MDVQIEIKHLVDQLETAVKMNQDTIEKLKSQISTKTDTVDLSMEYHYTLEFMASYQRKIFRNYSDGLHKIKNTYDTFRKDNEKETQHWKRKYEQEHLKQKELQKLIERILQTSQREFDEYGNIINMYQTYTDNLVEHFNKE